MAIDGKRQIPIPNRTGSLYLLLIFNMGNKTRSWFLKVFCHLEIVIRKHMCATFQIKVSGFLVFALRHVSIRIISIEYYWMVIYQRCGTVMVMLIPSSLRLQTSQRRTSVWDEDVISSSIDLINHIKRYQMISNVLLSYVKFIFWSLFVCLFVCSFLFETGDTEPKAYDSMLDADPGIKT